MHAQIGSGGLQPLGPSSISQLAKVAMLTAMHGVGNPWEGAEAHLFTNNVTPTPKTVPGDLTVPTWTGYSSQTFTWENASAEGDEGAALYGDSVIFTSGSDANEVVYGYYLVDSGGDLILAELFDTPIPMVGVQQIPVLPGVLIQ